MHKDTQPNIKVIALRFDHFYVEFVASEGDLVTLLNLAVHRATH